MDAKAQFRKNFLNQLPERQQRLAEVNMARRDAQKRTLKRFNDYLTDRGLDAVPFSSLKPVIEQTEIGPLDSHVIPPPVQPAVPDPADDFPDEPTPPVPAPTVTPPVTPPVVTPPEVVPPVPPAPDPVVPPTEPSTPPVSDPEVAQTTPSQEVVDTDG